MQEQKESMMMRLPDRRAMLLAAGTAAVVAVARRGFAQSTDIRGTVAFDGGDVVPEGRIEIYVENPAVQGKARRAEPATRLESNGKSETIEFSLPPPPSTTVAKGTRIVARLERADGWLLARGSAGFEIGSPITVTLYPVMY